MMKQQSDIKKFFQYVIPSVLSFALSGVYAIVDGFFVGNSLGDVGISAVNIAYPIVAVIQALGTGIGMGGAIYYAIHKAGKNEKRASEFAAGALWLMAIASVFSTFLVFALNRQLLMLLGASGEMLALGEEYIAIIALGAGLQVTGTGLVPFIRNHGGSFYAMAAMIAGFVTNIILDYWFVWVLGQGVAGAALATIIGQGITMLMALVYLLQKRQVTFSLPASQRKTVFASILKIGIAPFGLAMTPNISLMIINRFSVAYGGEQAIATYACIAYVICIIYLVLQGVGDGSQPLISKCYGERDFHELRKMRKFAYGFAMLLSVVSCVLMYVGKGHLGILFGTSATVNVEIAKIIPIFLVSVPFVAVSRITTASFYAMDKNTFSYILTFIEPVLMFVFMLFLPPLFGGQVMIWWSTVLARILSALLAFVLKGQIDKRELLEERELLKG